MDTLKVVSIAPGEAVQALQGVAKRDPRGITTPQDIAHFAERGQCFALRGFDSQITYVLTIENGQCWVQAAQAVGPFSFEDVLSEVIERQARAVCHSVAFQTSRRGLKRKAEKAGYRVTGWILKKDITT